MSERHPPGAPITTRSRLDAMDSDRADVAVIGAGAAGLMCAVWAGRSLQALRAASSGRPDARLIALDGARTLGAKILVAGGGRCNVTHDHVDESAYAGSSRHAIKKVLRSFDVARTIEFFRRLGVELKREETGKLFPTTDDARTILRSLLSAAADAGAEIIHPWRVESVERLGDKFLLRERGETVRSIVASRIVLATGGKSLPKSGSDGHGYEIARALGHTITSRVFPALVPLVLGEHSPLRALSGITLPATLEVRAGAGKRLVSFTDSTLLTHFGLSGPSVLDVSRYYLDARADDPGASLIVNFLPGESCESLERAMIDLGKRPVRAWLRTKLPERLADALCAEAGVGAELTGASLTRLTRVELARSIAEHRAPVAGDRGYTHAEVTAGGVPLREINLATMESRVCPGLHLIGEICDVDGRIGGYNFQWAWASGFVAGSALGSAY